MGKNLLKNLDKLAEMPYKSEKERSDWGDRKYYRSWSAYIGKVAKVNPENLLGQHHDVIVTTYLHTLPEEFRNLGHLYQYLNVCTITKDGVFNDSLFGRRLGSFYGRKAFYYFNEDGILSVKRKTKLKPKPFLTKAERMRKFYEDKKAKNKRYREIDAHNKRIYSEMLTREDFKRRENEKQSNIQKMISKGFDPVTSFRPDRKPKENDK